jgi:hypothetical protein
MNQISQILILAFFFAGCTTKNASKSNFDFSSIEPFWKVVSILKKNKEPSNEVWDSLLLTPGYLEFTRREITMKNYLRLGILPSKNEKLNEWIKKDYNDIKFPLHFREVVKNKSQINHFIENIKGSDLSNQSLSLAINYLPENIDTDSIPPVSFIFFEKDARGYNPILIDALYASELYKINQFKTLLAHEMHHHIRDKHLSFTYPPQSSSDYNIVTTINQIHSEGIADLIDKDASFNNSFFKERTKKYQELLKQAPIHIEQLDSLLSTYSKNKNLQNNIATTIEISVPMSGHTLGYFMAKTIENYKSKEFLIKDIGDPFQFFIHYQEAVIKSGNKKPKFSKESLYLLENLAQKYSK